MKINLPIAFASLLLSLMLWVVVYSQNAPQPDNISAPLSIDGLDDNRFFVRKVPTDVALVVSGPSDRMKAMRAEKVTASVDLSQAKAGEHDYPISLSPTWVGKYLTGGRPTARLTLETISSRVVPVTRLIKGVLRDSNLQLTNQRTSPTQVTVRGPESEVETVHQARTFLDLSLIDPQNPAPQESEAVPLDNRESRPPHVRTTPAVVVHFFSIGASPGTKLAQVVPDMSLTYGASVLPDGYRIEPKSVNLTGKPADLANISKVPTEPIRLEEISETKTVRVRLLPPLGTTIVGSPYVSVTVRVRPGNPPRKKPLEPSKPPVSDPPPTEPPVNR